MRKKIIAAIACVAVLAGVVGAGYYFVLKPRLDKQNADAAVLDESGVDETETDEIEIDTDIGEGDLDPFAGDPEFQADSVVDLDSLTDDQRERVLAGELTMDELAEEIALGAPVVTNEGIGEDTGALGTNNSGWDEIGTIWDGIGGLDDPAASEEAIDTDINYGEPDTEFGTDLTGVETEDTDEPVGSTATLDTVESAAPTEPAETEEVMETSAPRTADPMRTVPIAAIMILVLAVMAKAMIAISKKGASA